MAPKRDSSKSNRTHAKRKEEETQQNQSPKISIRDPTVPASIPSTAREQIPLTEPKSKCKTGAKSCLRYIYNPENKTICERTCSSWGKIILYSIMYLIFLATYFLIFLYLSLLVVKATTQFSNQGGNDLAEPLIFVRNGVGLSATPTSVDIDGKSLIWYRANEDKEYEKYINGLNELLSSRNKTSEVIKALGPCSQPPYGYGDKPCVIIRINKQLNWVGKPLSLNSTLMRIAPEEVKNWVRSGKNMLWLHCEGYDSYDQEHLGEITYHPYPPGYDPNLFPLDPKNDSPLVAVQFSEFTHGVSLSVLCKLWYEAGPSSVHFTLYVGPQIKANSSSIDSSLNPKS